MAEKGGWGGGGGGGGGTKDVIGCNVCNIYSMCTIKIWVSLYLKTPSNGKFPQTRNLMDTDCFHKVNLMDTACFYQGNLMNTCMQDTTKN